MIDCASLRGKRQSPAREPARRSGATMRDRHENVRNMSRKLAPIPEWRNVDAALFRGDIVPANRPAVLRGLIDDWPAVARARKSAESIAGYLDRFTNGAAVDVLMMAPHVRGRLFYSDDMRGFNYSRSAGTIKEVSDKLLRYSKFDNRPSLAVQSALLRDCLPGFGTENRLAMLDASIEPRIWLGSAITTPAHFDESSNVACVVSGTRRFTLFPPEQITNLYIGPLGHAPTGTPISLVSFSNPDHARFPRFAQALASALVAELSPGDALYIPPLWWHHVESLGKYNMLVNYWWKGDAAAPDPKADTALNCLLHSLLTLKRLPDEQRQAWKVIFDHYLFDAKPDSFDHIPQSVRGALGDMSPELAMQIRAFLVKQLQR
jgi:cupin-like protein